MSSNDEIHAMRAREVELLHELNRPRPIERAPDVETALAAIRRREDAERELEAVRAVRRHLIDEAKVAERRAVAVAELRRRLPLIEADLADATARSDARGAAAIADDLAVVRRRIAALEAEGAVSA